MRQWPCFTWFRARITPIDFNDLKGINDRYGHSAGHTAIITAAEGIREAFQGLGRCYRIGGDEFLAVLENVSEQEILDAEQTMYQYLEQKSQGAAL